VAWALVQSAAATPVSPAATITKAFTSNVTAGNRVFVYVGASSGGTATVPATPTDTQSNTYTALLTNQLGTNNPYIAVYTAVMASTGANTVTVGVGTLATTGGTELALTMEEFSGLDSSAGSGCVDKSATGNGSTTSFVLATTAATTASNQLAIAAASDWGASVTMTTASSGWTKDAGSSRDADAIISQFVATKLSASGTTETLTLAASATADQIVGGIVVIKLASAATSNPIFRPRMTSQAVRRAAFF
jgi:hypothetical protein